MKTLPRGMSEDLIALFARLAKSNFRRRFKLRPKELAYLRGKGLSEVMGHARKIICERLGPAHIPNDGKQTPMRNHPVFIAQHATATCCRGCLQKWHGIEKGGELSEQQFAYVLSVLEKWLKIQNPGEADQPTLFD